MKTFLRAALGAATLAAPFTTLAHDGHAHADDRPAFSEELRQRILSEWIAKEGAPTAASQQTVEGRVQTARPSIGVRAGPQTPRAIDWPGANGGPAMPAWARPQPQTFRNRPLLASAALSPMSLGMSSLTFGALALFQAPAGNGALMAASFSPFRPNVRFYNDANYFYVESDSMPDATLMPTPMVGITAWQQQLPIPVGYFGNVTNPEGSTGSLGYGQPNVWRIPLVPVPAASPISLSENFLRGAVALGANGIPIFNPRNNTGQFSQAIGELDAYGGHCGRADDYHYHIAPTHLYSVLTPDKPCAWALDGYPIYGYVEPDGSPQQALDADGGHDHGGWGYHYHARGSAGAGPQSPYLMNAMHGAVVNFGGQIDPQPTASSISPTGAPLAGAVITGFTRPAKDSYVLTYTLAGTAYQVSYTMDRIAHSIAVSTQSPSGTANATYTSAARFNYYPMAPWSMARLPDTGQVLNATATFGEDSDYTINAPSFTDHGNGTVTDNVTGLMWQKTDSGEMTWDNARASATSLSLAGFTDWRLPTAQEAFSIQNHERNPSLDPTYFVESASGSPPYFWTSDLFYGDNTKVWCTNSGGGLGPHAKTATISAGGANRHLSRYVRGTKPTTGHNYTNNNDGTITDLDTSLMWTQVPASAMNWTSALTYTEGLTTGGYTDWRLPNVKELQSLEDIPRATASGTTTVPCLNRILFPAATATAYWSSTSVKSGTPTQAWLVDFGVTTTSTPSRNQQGIVSYEPYASTYPVFAVRTTSVTTQMVVSESGSPLTDGASTVGYGSVNVGTTQTKTFAINNTGGTTLTITGVTIDGANGSNFSVTTAPASSIAAGGSTTLTVLFNANTLGSKAAALHIASSDPGNSSFDINLTGTGLIPPPTISNVTVNPLSPTSTDAPVITAQVTPGSGGSITGVNLTYDLGAQVTSDKFKETFAMASSNGWNGTGGLNTWVTAGAGATRQANLTSNRTSPVVMTNCTTTSGGQNIVCASTASLWPNMIITGPGMVAGAAISSITNATTFVISAAATATSSTAMLTANGMTLTNCTTAANTTVTCDSTVGLLAGMGLTGTGLANNATVSSITNATSFVMSANPTTPGTGLTLTGNGNALEFQAASASLTTAMATSPTINATGTSGYIDFYVQTRDLNNLTPNNQWTFQVSPDGTNWTTRFTEDWTSSVVNLTNVVTNSAGSGTGSTTVTCASTTGLTTGRAVSATPVYATGGVTSGSPTVTCSNTASLQVGMFVTSTGNTIPNNTRITAISANVSFTMSANAAATVGAAAIAGNFFPPNATVSSITNGTTFVLSTPAYANTSASPIAALATTINHGFTTKADGTPQPYRYVLDATERTASMKMRFQYAGSAVTSPTRAPRVSIDDIVVNTTTGAVPQQVTMLDDGTNGDAVAGDGIWSGRIPAQANSANVNFTITAVGSAGSGTTTSSTTSYTVAPAPTITSSATLPNAIPNVAYSTTLAATGGTPGYTWSILSGALPGGVTLSSGGVISGTTSAQGTFHFTVKVTDSAGRIASKAFALTVTTTTAPNVLIILTDDQGWADVGYHTAAGQVPIQTPNMDRFGTDGIRLEKFYATTVCSVTRGALLTGRNSLRTSVGNQKGLGLAEHLMPQTFKAAGYQTFMCGKWHIGGWDNNIYTTTMNGATIEVQHEGDEYLPHNRGWDFHKGQYGGAINYFTHTSIDPGKNNAVDWWQNGVQLPNDNTDPQGNGGYSTDLLADKAVELIQTRDPSKPMLLYLAFNAIHAGVSAPQSYLNKYAALGVPAPRRTIAAAVDCMDVAMGRVLAALDTAGITNNTLVVFMSDNGGDTSAGELNSPLRGTKSDSYDGGLHTLAGIRFPGRLAAGVTSDQYVWVGDMFPTICAAVGVTPLNTKPFDGVNLWPALQSITTANPNGAPRGAPLVTGDNGGPVALNLFTDPVSSTSKMFKLIYDKSTNPVTRLLFNMTDDVVAGTTTPVESTDLWLNGSPANPAHAAAYTTIVNTLTAAITPGIVPENYPPYIGPSGLTQTVAVGGSITLHTPFTSYRAPTVQWRKNGANIANASPFYQVTNSTGGSVNGVYMATLTIANATAADAANYDVTVTSTSGTVTSPTGALTVLAAPVLTALPTYSAGTSRSVSWAEVSGATSYTVQVAATANFASPLASQVVATPNAGFSGLAGGSLYYYRVTATDGTITSVFSNVVSSTQDAGNPVLAITSQGAVASTTRETVVLQGTASDALSGVVSVTVNGSGAATSNAYANWSSTLPLAVGAKAFTVTATDSVGNTQSTALTITRQVSTQNDRLPDSWKIANGLDPSSSAAVFGPGGDPEFDGLVNLLEYAFNRDPQAHDGDPVQSTSSGGYFQVSYPRRIGALDLTYTVETSADLATWSSAVANYEVVSIAPNSDGVTETVTVRVLPAMSGAGKMFFHVKVTTPSP